MATSREQARWRIYRITNMSNKRVDLDERDADTAMDALLAFAAERGWEGKPQGRTSLAVLREGLLRAEKVRVVARPEQLPSVDEMRAVLIAGAHKDANFITDTAVELRYRANVLGEQMVGPGGALERLTDERSGGASDGASTDRLHPAAGERKEQEMARKAAGPKEAEARAQREAKAGQNGNVAVSGASGADLAKALMGQVKAAVPDVEVVTTKSYDRFSVNSRTIIVAKLTTKGFLTVEVRPKANKTTPPEKFSPKAESDLIAVVEASKKAAEAASK